MLHPHQHWCIVVVIANTIWTVATSQPPGQDCALSEAPISEHSLGFATRQHSICCRETILGTTYFLLWVAWVGVEEGGVAELGGLEVRTQVPGPMEFNGISFGCTKCTPRPHPPPSPMEYTPTNHATTYWFIQFPTIQHHACV